MSISNNFAERTASERAPSQQPSHARNDGRLLRDVILRMNQISEPAQCGFGRLAGPFVSSEIGTGANNGAGS
jgi:hypothetical protein